MRTHTAEIAAREIGKASANSECCGNVNKVDQISPGGNGSSPVQPGVSYLVLGCCVMCFRFLNINILVMIKYPTASLFAPTPEEMMVFCSV